MADQPTDESVREYALLPSKANLLQGLPPARIFTLHDGFQWQGIDDSITLFDLLKRDQTDNIDSSSLKKAIEWVKESLSGSDMQSKTLEYNAKEDGISLKTRSRAYKTLGVKSYILDKVYTRTLP